jgi:predicted DCC family thiol-disulfide oxidoreductase YuxK
VSPVLVFDGECGFCARALGWLRLADRHRLIDTVPYQHAGVPERLGLSRERCAESLHWRGEDGAVVSGAEAISAALAVALDARWPERLYRHTSGGQERLYRWVAAHRHRLPGITPWCARYPHDCAPPPGAAR